MKKINGLMGYSSRFPSLDLDLIDVVAEVCTNGRDVNGYEVAETLGVARSEFGNLCLYRGSNNDNPVIDKHVVLQMSSDGAKLSTVLRALANHLDELSL